jgi:hypothetical protein
LRRSGGGLSLVRGDVFAVANHPEQVEIELGDQWQSRLGMNLTVADQPMYTWYRVVRHRDVDVTEDVYLRKGTFDIVSLRHASPKYVICFRFCNVDKPETFKSHRGKAKGWNTENKKRDSLTESQLMRAMEHMDGAIEDSPFVSVATDEQALLKFGHSGGLKDIMFGVDKRDERAPHIAIFHIPEDCLVSPEFIKQKVKGAGTMIGLARASKETELVYYGDDIRQYKVRHKDNPYGPAHFNATIAALGAVGRDTVAALEVQQNEKDDKGTKTRCVLTIGGDDYSGTLDKEDETNYFVVLDFESKKRLRTKNIQDIVITWTQVTIPKKQVSQIKRL